jgi:hypothetical protein
VLDFDIECRTHEGLGVASPLLLAEGVMRFNAAGSQGCAVSLLGLDVVRPLSPAVTPSVPAPSSATAASPAASAPSAPAPAALVERSSEDAGRTITVTVGPASHLVWPDLLIFAAGIAAIILVWSVVWFGRIWL